MFLVIENDEVRVAINTRNVALARLDAMRLAPEPAQSEKGPPGRDASERARIHGVDLVFTSGHTEFFPNGPTADVIREHFRALARRPQIEPGA